ncbi:GTP-binding protein [Hydrococcus rivularis NIES-593]|uniref:GTP-binding protein n=1 Tax=Hydrococcus rivularis NIES-593 TaxID=1921803 RepID=A0A1U7H9S9_9CYAN|nr:Rab family GTPase [Hydrococcus rivularis]OKH20339.1 GTP-binding protein [Hydrococcus rivularis NIES-593]
MSVISKKICFIGDYGVGKTSLIRRFVDRQFSDQYLSTLGVKISRKLVEIPTPKGIERQKVQLLIWDLEGRTKFHAITSSYLQGATGAIIVADLNRRDTIARIQEHVELVSCANPRGISAIVALNKSDLIDGDGLENLSEIARFQDHSHILPTYITSARTGENVDEMFQKLAHRMLEGVTA